MQEDKVKGKFEKAFGLSQGLRFYELPNWVFIIILHFTTKNNNNNYQS